MAQIPFWWRRGRANLKWEVASRVMPDMGSLPVNTDFLEFLKAEHREGRPLVLVTGASARTGEAAAKHFGLFGDVIGSDREVNLTGEKKAARLAERFGEKQFDYAGNERMDLKVWPRARRIVVVNGGNGIVQAARKLGDVEKVFERPRWNAADLLRALRVHQWAKNLLLLMPLLGAHRWTDGPKLLQAAIAFVAFCFCASSVYILNDLLDLESDRHHHRQQHRPLAAGRIPLVWGLIGAPLLLLAGGLIASSLGWGLLGVVAVYYVLTLLYSLRLKQVAILDVVALASLYGIRVVAGGVATGTAVTDWLLVFSMFLFVSLAFAKRFTELQWARGENREQPTGRGYRTGDVELISSMGVGSGYLSVLVLAFYISSPAVTQLYRRPAALWLACPVLLYWISRIWLLAHRRALHDDPVVFALKDKQSWVVCLLILGTAFAAAPIRSL